MFSAWLRMYPQNKIDVRVYIHYIAGLLYSIHCFPCFQDLARLKTALNILAHVPKSLLDPGTLTHLLLRYDMEK